MNLKLTSECTYNKQYFDKKVIFFIAKRQDFQCKIEEVNNNYDILI